MSASSTYQMYGRHIRSNINFGLPVDEPGPIDLDLYLEPEPAPKLDTAVPPGVAVVGGEDDDFNFVVCRDDDGYLMRVRDLVDIRFNLALDRATCRPGPGIGEAHMKDLGATVLSSWMVLRGGAVFHGSAVYGVPGLPGMEALAFIGPSFGGKSTWAALMCSTGARFLTDDALPIGAGDGKPTVEGGCPELRLRRFGADQWPAFTGLPQRETVDGRLAVLAGAPGPSPIPLSCVIVLEQQEEGDNRVVLEPMSPREALVKLAGSYRVARLRLPEAHVAHFERATEVVSSVPVLSARVPPGPPAGTWAEELLAGVGARLDNA